MISKKSVKNLTAIAAALVLGGVAHATNIAYQQTFVESPTTLGYNTTYTNQAITVTVTDLGTPTDKTGDTFTGYTAYLLALSTPGGQPVGTVGLGGGTQGASFVGTGFSGTFLQEWVQPRHGAITPTPYSSTMSSGAYDSGDSHFLVNPSGGTGYDGSNGVVVVNQPTEDSNQITPAGLAGAASSSGYAIGTGTTMTYTYGLENSTLPTMNVAYLVVPTGSGISFNGLESSSFSSQYSDLVPFSGTFGAVPEPATMALFVLGGLGILTLGRKRKSA